MRECESAREREREGERDRQTDSLIGRKGDIYLRSSVFDKQLLDIEQSFTLLGLLSEEGRKIDR